ncbi:hypothetical protein HAX54_046896, partial [Datura stramonium]|nr:hypothetical protein [Datura stramonium]
MRFLALRHFAGADPRIASWSQLLIVSFSILRCWQWQFTGAHLQSVDLQPSSR